jgi:ABC-type nitrate/sulfonate/bicarbonate transport system substrate-binding protein
VKQIYYTLSLVFILLLTACGGDNEKQQAKKGADDQALTPVSFVLDWTPNTNHTGIYAAKANGYFEKQGLDVEIKLPGEVGANQMIASGKADFGVSYQEGLTQARAEGLPLVSIAAVMQHNTAGYASPAGKKITEPKDLEGKTYGGNGSPLEKAMMGTIMKQHHADIDQVDFLTIGDSDFFTAVKRDIDFSLVYYGWTGIEAELRGEDLNMIYLADFSDQLDFYTPILATSEKMVEKDPDLVKAFVHAAAEGYQYAIDNPEEAADILLDYEPDLDPELVKKSQAWLSPRYQDDAAQWGIQEKERWEDFITFMTDNNIIDEPLKAEEAFTNTFLPEK